MKTLHLVLSITTLVLSGNPGVRADSSLFIDMSSVPEKGFHSTQPARTWEESLLTGNGTMGAMVEGSPHREAIVLNHALLYLPLFKPLKPVSQGKHLDKIRQLTLEGKYTEASRYVVDLSHTEGYGRKRATDLFIPAFQLNVTSAPAAVRDYCRTVDFSTGEVEVKWRDDQGIYSRRLFISRPDNIVVMQWRALDGEPIDTQLDLSQITRHDEGRLKKYQLDEDLGIARVESSATQNGLSFKAWYSKPWDGSFKGYEGYFKVTLTGGRATAEAGRLTIRGAREALLLGRIEPCRNMDVSLAAEIGQILDACPLNYETLMGRHRAIHQKLFDRVSLDLKASDTDRRLSSEALLQAGGDNPALIEKLFDAARYNIICATGVNPPNLQGIWGATMTPPWSGDYTTNGNLPVAVSHLLQANTPELMLPLFNRLESFQDAFKINARELFNCRGIHVPSRFSTHGLNNHFDETWPMTFWTAGAAWYSLFYYDYYLYTLDEDFLRKRALPFMEQAALFYKDFLTEAANGNYVFNPSYSPENHPANSPGQACINAAMDVMAANALLRSLIAASQTLGINQDKIPTWEAMMAKMPPYQLNDNGEIREWMWSDLKDNHEHRHASHLFGLYDYRDPQIMNRPDLIEGCKKAIGQRLAIRRKDNGGIMAFGMIQLGFSASALGQTETAYDILTWLGNSYWNNNLVSTHDPGRIFNLDISGGYPSLVMKMLVYAEPGKISLLPCAPKQWPAGCIQGVALRGGILLKKMTWNEKGISVLLDSKVDQTVSVQFREEQRANVTLKAGEILQISF